MKILIRTIAAALLCASAMALPATTAKADLLCPKAVSSHLHTHPTWRMYQARAQNYIQQWKRRMTRRFNEVVSARSQSALNQAGSQMGRDTDLLMQRMWEEGFIAATDIIYAYCVRAPDTSPWSEAIRRQREEAWCKKEKTAHFCR